MVWFRKAADLNDPSGICSVGHYHGGGLFLFCEMLRKAAARGHVKSMCYLDMGENLSPIERAKYGARAALLSGTSVHLHSPLRCKEGDQILDPIVMDDVLYAAGRELEGYSQIWDSGYLYEPNQPYVERSIDVYLTVTHRARRAALQTVAGLWQVVGLPHDVAVLIGRAVYETRADARAWLGH